MSFGENFRNVFWISKPMNSWMLEPSELRAPLAAFAALKDG